jgi:hypothetical protein
MTTSEAKPPGPDSEAPASLETRRVRSGADGLILDQAGVEIVPHDQPDRPVALERNPALA